MLLLHLFVVCASSIATNVLVSSDKDVLALHTLRSNDLHPLDNDLVQQKSQVSYDAVNDVWSISSSALSHAGDYDQDDLREYTLVHFNDSLLARDITPTINILSLRVRVIGTNPIYRQKTGSHVLAGFAYDPQLDTGIFSAYMLGIPSWRYNYEEYDNDNISHYHFIKPPHLPAMCTQLSHANYRYCDFTTSQLPSVNYSLGSITSPWMHLSLRIDITYNNWNLTSSLTIHNTSFIVSQVYSSDEYMGSARPLSFILGAYGASLQFTNVTLASESVHVVQTSTVDTTSTTTELEMQHNTIETSRRQTTTTQATTNQTQYTSILVNTTNTHDQIEVDVYDVKVNQGHYKYTFVAILSSMIGAASAYLLYKCIIHRSRTFRKSTQKELFGKSSQKP